MTLRRLLKAYRSRRSLAGNRHHFHMGEIVLVLAENYILLILNILLLFSRVMVHITARHAAIDLECTTVALANLDLPFQPTYQH